MTTTALKEYTIKDKTKHTEIQAHIFKNSLIIVERFFCVLQLLHWTCANHTLQQIMQRQHGHGPWKTECLCRTDQKGITLSPHWICYHWIQYDRGSTRYKEYRHYALCINPTRARCALEIRQHNMYLCKIIRILSKNIPYVFLSCTFLYSFFQTYYYNM